MEYLFDAVIVQGFHRYSTDEDWHVPHFEKMLYDQAQLVVAYVSAYQVLTQIADVLWWVLPASLWHAVL